MSNAIVTPDLVAAEAVTILKNNLVMGNLVYRGYEEDFGSTHNGYKPGSTIKVRRPADFTVREGRIAAAQDVQEGAFDLTVDTQIGVDFKFTSAELTLDVTKLSERVIKPAMMQIVNYIDRDLLSLSKYVPNHITLPSGGVDSFADFALAPALMDKLAIPQDDRKAILSPTDHWAMLGSQTALYMQDVAKGAYRDASLGNIAGFDTFMSQNVYSHTTGARTDTDVTDTTSETYNAGHLWASVKDSSTVTFHIDGMASDTAGYYKAGDTFTIATVYSVNPVSKASTGVLQTFVVMSDTTSASSEADVSIWPPLITSGAHQTVSAPALLDGLTVTYQGVASTAYTQNLFFRKQAFALVMVPMEKPDGAVSVARKSLDGYSVRVIPYYDGGNDVSNWRLDVLYGKKVIDPRQAVRASLAANI